jgi:hypothetical protein
MAQTATGPACDSKDNAQSAIAEEEKKLMLHEINSIQHCRSIVNQQLSQ